MVHFVSGLAVLMRFWKVPRGVTKSRGLSDAKTARCARWIIFGIELQRMQMRPQIGNNRDFQENEGGNGAFLPRPGWSNAVLAGPMRFLQVPCGVTKPRGLSDAKTARGARWIIFGIELQSMRMRTPTGNNGDEGGHGELRFWPG